jgi:hypothetical protein
MLIENIEQNKAWTSALQVAPAYQDQPATGYAAIEYGVESPINDGPCTKFSLTQGKTPAGEVTNILNTIQLIGAQNAFGYPDKQMALLPTLHKFRFGGSFFLTSLASWGALELDLGIYQGAGFKPQGPSITWGTQIRVLNGSTGPSPNEWDTWTENQPGANGWIPSGVKGWPLAGQWNTFEWVFERDGQNNKLYTSVSLNGFEQWPMVRDKALIIPAEAGWWGMNANVQIAGTGAPLDVYVRGLQLETA